MVKGHKIISNSPYIYFGIRDDVCYWTKPKELEKIYKEFWIKDIPISFAVIPFVVRFYKCGD